MADEFMNGDGMKRFEETLKRASGDGPKGIFDKVEQAFDGLGMMKGDFAPLMRAGVGAGLGWLVINSVRPRAFYFENGRPRPWAFSVPEDTPGAVVIPWWSVPLGLAFTFGVLI